MCALVAEDDGCSLCSLPTNADASLIVEPSSPNMHENQNEDVVVGHCYATVITERSSDTWYIATCEGENENETYKMHHLMRVEAGSSLKWNHPAKRDLLNLHLASILDCKIGGEWNVINERKITFLLRKHNQIASLVEGLSFKDS